MSRFSKRLYLVNFFGTLFYLSCLLQWAWAILPYMPGIVRFTEMLHTPASTPEPVHEVTASGPPSLVLLIIACAATAIIIGFTLYILIKFPIAVARSGQKITQSASARIVPVVTHHAKLTPKKRQHLTARIIAYLKLTLCIVPIILGACSYFLNTPLTYDVIMIVTATLCIGSLLLLGAQMLFAKWLRVRSEVIW